MSGKTGTLFCALVLLTAIGCSTNKSKDVSAASLRVKEINSPADSLSAEPYLTTDSRGNVFLSWIARGATSTLVFSEWKDSLWSVPVAIASDSTWFINWADYPMIASDGGSNRMAFVLDKSAGETYTYDVKLFTSANEGATWETPGLLHDDGKKAEHGFVSLVPFKDNLFTVWLDGRNTASGEMKDHTNHAGSMTLRAAIVEYSGKKVVEWELDGKTCDCCQTAAAITQDGPVVIYRDRSDDEIRDIYITRLVNDTWTKPQPVYRDNWRIAGCPVNGPRITARNNQLAVAWFTAATEHGQVKVAFSDDNGKTFAEPTAVDEGNPIGRVDIEWIDDSRLIVVWMEDAFIKAALVHSDGRREDPITVAESSTARSSGFPQLTAVGQGMMVAWTDDSRKKVRSALLDIYLPK